MPSLTEKLCNKLNEAVASAAQMEQQLDISFTAHFDSSSIHPFYVGNGRTSRLLMNYVQHFFSLPMALVFLEDKAAYFEALQQTRNEEDTRIFLRFLYEQYKK